MGSGEELWLGAPQTPLNLFVFRVAAASPPQTEPGETPSPLPAVLVGVWGRAPAETTLSSLLTTHSGRRREGTRLFDGTDLRQPGD